MSVPVGYREGDDELFPEAATVLEWVSSLGSGDADDVEVGSKLCVVLNEYLEQGPLLDSVIPNLVRTLTGAVLEPREELRHPLFVVLCTVCKVRGIKHISRLLPHDHVTLRKLTDIALSRFPDEASSVLHWETQYVVLLWLSVAILAPFPLLSIVPEDSLNGLYEFSLRSLRGSSKISQGACLLLSAFLTRKDSAQYMAAFMDMCSHSEDCRGRNGPSTAAALARIFKAGKRDELMSFVPKLMKVVPDFVNESETGGMKLKAKLVQRMALVFLRERPCTWRYQRGSRRMIFGRTAVENENATSSSVPQDDPTVHSFVGDVADTTTENWINPAEEDIVEEVVDILLVSLRHRDTVVRWSAAKGIGRIAGRLPKIHAEDVVQAVVDLFTSPFVERADSAWHGGCLALAELARRGLILPGTDHFDALFRVVRRAATFDVRRGAHSVGAHVRDAACYVIWAVARAYTPEDVSPQAAAIAETMVPLALLDREVNCRRAASAAIQESVGRLSQGVIIEGLALVTLLDYFSLGDRTSCYTTIASKVSELAGGIYFSCVLNELWSEKLVHWDATIRTLSSQALAAFVPSDKKGELLGTVFPKLLGLVTERGDALHRHGAVLGLAELTRALGSSLSEENVNDLRRVPGRVASKGYFKGKVGDLMTIAVCRFVECCSRASIGVFTTVGDGRVAADESLSILERAMGSGKVEVTGPALQAYGALCHGVVCSDESWSLAICDRILEGLKSAALPELRRGHAMAAGGLESEFVTTDLLISLGRVLEADPDVEVRGNAAESLGKLAPITQPALREAITRSLQVGMHDYAIDDRGDVGSWVREASMTAFSRIFSHELAFGKGDEDSPDASLDEACLQCIRSMTRQSCERINRTRAVACSGLLRLAKGLAARGGAAPLPQCDIALRGIARAFVEEADRMRPVDKTDFVSPNWDADTGTSSGDARLPWPADLSSVDNVIPSDLRALTFLSSKFLRVLPVWKDALTGTIAGCGTSSGGGANAATRLAAEGIYELSRELATRDPAALLELGNTLVSFLSGSEDRLVTPAMIALEHLVREGVFSTVSLQPVLVRSALGARRSWRARMRDMPRVSAAVSLLSELAAAQLVLTAAPRARALSAARTSSLEALMIVLAGPVPRLRRIAASGLYVALQDGLSVGCAQLGSAPDAGVARGDVAATRRALDALADTPWERLAVPAAREARNGVCTTLGVAAPAPARPPVSH